MRDQSVTKNKEKGTENNYKKKGKRIPNRKSWYCLDCDKNCKCIQEDYQTNNNYKN